MWIIDTRQNPTIEPEVERLERGPAVRERGPRRRSVANLLRDLRDEGTRLLRQEVALAKAEMSEKAAKLGRNAGILTTGGAVLFAGLLFLLLAGSHGLTVGLQAAGLSTAVAVWLAPLMVGAVVALVGLMMVLKARRTIRREPLVPQKTLDSLQETKEWARQKVKST